MALKFQKKVKRDKAITIRLTAESAKRLKAIAQRHGVSQADVIEKMIEMNYDGLEK